MNSTYAVPGFLHLCNWLLSVDFEGKKNLKHWFQTCINVLAYMITQNTETKFRKKCNELELTPETEWDWIENVKILQKTLAWQAPGDISLIN